MVALNVVRTITIKSQTDGVQQTTAQLQGLSKGYDQVGTSAKNTATVTDMASKSQLSMEAALKRSQMQLDASIRSQQNYQQAQQKMAAANDNLGKSYVDFERSKSEFDQGIVSTIGHTLELINHLKLVALAAYAMVPAFRSFVNTEIQQSARLMRSEFAAMLPTIEAIGQRALPYVQQGLQFLTRISVPLTVAVVAWETLNYVIGKGADLLHKYTLEQQRIDFGSGNSIDAQLARATRFQSDLSAQQQLYATQLSGRLEEAKKQIHNFFFAEVDVNDAALALQSIWVRIVELFGRVLTTISNIRSIMKGAAEDFGNASFWDKWNKWWAEHAPGLGANLLPGTITPGPTGILPGTVLPKEDLTAAMAAARESLAAGIQGGASFQSRFEAMFAQPPAPKAPAGPNALDRFNDQMKTTIEELSLEAQGASKTSAEVEELKIAHEGFVAATKAGKEPTDEMRAQWKAWADQIAALNIQIRQTKALQEEQFKGATMFMSPADQAAAQVAHQIDPTNWQAHLQDAAAQLARFNSIMGQTRDLAVGFGDSFEQSMLQGKSATESLQGALRNLESQLLSMINKIGINALFSLITPPSGGATFLGGGNWVTGKAKGDAFQDGRVIPFASGGIFNSPTLFPMASGMGLMGEAGPEAVMPLTRDSSGKLGVQGGGVVNNFIVENHTGGQVSEQKQKNSTGGIDHRLIIRTAVAEDLASGAYDGAMRARFGQQIRARPR